MKEYWVDVETTGSFEDENEESFTEKTLGEGVADGFDLGLAPVDTTAHDPGDDPDEVTDLEDVEDDSASSKAKLKVPSKTDVEQEHALEAGIHIDTYDIHTATTKHSQISPIQSVFYFTCGYLGGHRKCWQCDGQHAESPVKNGSCPRQVGSSGH